MLTFGDYQKAAARTAVYPHQGANIMYPVLGLVNEAGEVAGKLKKVLRDRGGCLDAERRADILMELGDVLWYAAAICTELGVSLESVAQSNLDKLASRAARGVLRGDGDAR